MARKSRQQLLIPGQPNHIISRGNNGRRLFSYPRDYLAYLRRLSFGLVRFRCVLHALCLMANHVHLLMTPPSVEATSKLLQHVNQRYAQLRNGSTDRSGKLFEERFWSDPIEDEKHLAAEVLYIDANPIEAGLRNAERYPWSTHQLHAGRPSAARIAPDMIRFDPWYLSLGSSPMERAEHYRHCLAGYLGGDRDKEHVQRVREQEPAPSTRRLERPGGKSAK